MMKKLLATLSLMSACALPLLASAGPVDVARHYQALAGHPLLQIAFRQTLDNPALASILIKNLQTAQDTEIGGDHVEKIPVLAMAMDSTTRWVLDNALMAEKHQRSDEIEARLSNPEASPVVVDLVIIGGTGPAGTQIAMKLDAARSPLKALIIEKGETFLPVEIKSAKTIKSTFHIAGIGVSSSY